MTATVTLPAAPPVADAAAAACAWAPCLKALGDETRLHLALLLAGEPRTVKGLQEATGLGQPLVSHHLRLLREAGLVSATPRGRTNVYTLCCTELVDVVRCLAAMTGADAAC
jgi:DNA-binding transcriptional ArsR family regulator